MVTLSLTVSVLLVLAAFITAVAALANKVHAAVPVLLLCVLELLRLGTR